ILYTSADSVLQLAAHEGRVPLAELYGMCAAARTLCDDRPEWRVGRVIARPFTGDAGRGFTRTPDRHDYAVPPPEGMLLDRLAERGVAVHAIGKVSDLFLGRGIAAHTGTRTNAEGLEATEAALTAAGRGLIFVNLVDFDMLFGHRNDAAGFAGALAECDRGLGRIIARLGRADLLLVTADHGCDPTTASTDHTREYVPLLAYAPGCRAAALGTRATLADVGQTIAENFGVGLRIGRSYLGAIEPRVRRAPAAGCAP
ncbi:MAG: phosphopentomutase, partial [Streptosporangiaceae bacterium]